MLGAFEIVGDAEGDADKEGAMLLEGALDGDALIVGALDTVGLKLPIVGFILLVGILLGNKLGRALGDKLGLGLVGAGMPPFCRDGWELGPDDGPADGF